MNTFRNEYFKNILDPKTAYYECVRNFKINKSIEGVENCILKCEIPLSVSQGYRFLKANIYNLDYET